MELKIVDFETAKQLNKLGFPLDYDNAIYITKDCIEDDGNYGRSRKEGELVYFPSGLCQGGWISAPTLELAKKWLLEEKKYYVDITPNFWLTQDKKIFKFEEFCATIFNLNNEDLTEVVKSITKKKRDRKTFKEYDSALEWGIKTIIQKLLKPESD